MPAPQQIDSLLRHAHMQEQQAQARWLKTRHKVESAKSQLVELQRYAQDYAVARSTAQLQTRALLNHQRFTDRLQEAVVQQSQSLRGVREEESQAQKLWQQERCQLQALQLMQERRAAAAQQIGNRREQHRLDEMSSQMGRYEFGARNA
ncbi:MAG: flagellar export protein FliJ [Oceanococcus sp.]